MAATLIPNLLAAHCMTMLTQELDPWGSRIYADSFRRDGATFGATVRVRRRFRYGGYLVGTMTEVMDMVLIEHNKTVRVDLPDQWNSYSIDSICVYHLRPAMEALAETIKGLWGLGATLVSVDQPMWNSTDAGIVHGDDLTATWGIQRNVLSAAIVFSFSVLFGFANQPPPLPVENRDLRRFIAGAKLEKERLEALLKTVQAKPSDHPAKQSIFSADVVADLDAILDSINKMPPVIVSGNKIGATIKIRKPPRFTYP